MSDAKEQSKALALDILNALPARKKDGGLAKLTNAQATDLCAVALRGMGYTQQYGKRPAAFVHPGGKKRVFLKTLNYRKEDYDEKRKEWVTGRSIPLQDRALEYLAWAVETLGADHAAVGAQLANDVKGWQHMRAMPRERAASEHQRKYAEQCARAAADAIIEVRRGPDVVRVAREKTEGDAALANRLDTAREKVVQELFAHWLATNEVAPEPQSYYTLDRPPIKPLFFYSGYTLPYRMQGRGLSVEMHSTATGLEVEITDDRTDAELSAVFAQKEARLVSLRKARTDEAAQGALKVLAQFCRYLGYWDFDRFTLPPGKHPSEVVGAPLYEALSKRGWFREAAEPMANHLAYVCGGPRGNPRTRRRSNPTSYRRTREDFIAVLGKHKVARANVLRFAHLMKDLDLEYEDFLREIDDAPHAASMSVWGVMELLQQMSEARLETPRRGAREHGVTAQAQRLIQRLPKPAWWAKQTDPWVRAEGLNVYLNLYAMGSRSAWTRLHDTVAWNWLPKPTASSRR